MSSTIISSAYTGPTLVLGSGDDLIVTSTGSVSGVIVNAGGDEIVDGLTTSDTVNSGGFTALAGRSVDTVVNGGSDAITGSATSLTVVSNGSAVVQEGGMTTAATIGTNGTFEIYNSSTASATIISNGGLALVGQGGTADGVTVDSGGHLVVLPGADATGITTASGGYVTSTGVVIVAPGLEEFFGGDSGGTVSSASVFVLDSGTLAGVTLIGDTVTIYSGGAASGNTLSGFEYLSGGVDSGAMVASGGAQQIGSGGIATSTTIDSGGSAQLGSGGTAVSPMLISGGSFGVDSGGVIGGAILLSGTGNVVSDFSLGFSTSGGVGLSGATISGFVSGNTIVAAGDYNSGITATINSSTFVLTISGETIDNTAVPFSYQLNAAAANDIFTVSSFNEGEIAIVAECFLPGTGIGAEHGEVAVEDLRVGDRVRTLSGALRPIRWIGTRVIDPRRHPDPAAILPVRIAAHAFADRQPRRPLFLSPDHAVFFKGALVPVRYLVNGTSVTQATLKTAACDAITYYHIELETHDILLAENLAVESYLDTGNRAGFANGGPVMQLHADFAEATYACARLREALSYAPLTVTGRIVEAARRRLAARAAAAGRKRGADARAM